MDWLIPAKDIRSNEIDATPNKVLQLTWYGAPFQSALWQAADQDVRRL